jgi:hypothetical protein
VSLAFRGDVLPMPEIGAESPLEDLYAGLDLGEPPAA